MKYHDVGDHAFLHPAALLHGLQARVTQILGGVIAEDRHDLHERDVVFTRKSHAGPARARASRVHIAQLFEGRFPGPERRLGIHGVARHRGSLELQPTDSILLGHLVEDDFLGGVRLQARFVGFPGIELARFRIRHRVLVAVPEFLHPVLRLQEHRIQRG